VILVARPDHTNRILLNKAIEMVPKEKLLGVLLNCAQEWFLWKAHSYYYYQNYAAAER
jgi:Mrp family chromosome partitioning ATPase